MASLGRAVPIEILPERVLVRTADTVVWWMPESMQTMFFSDRGGDEALKRVNGKVYPQPPLVFKATGSHLWVRALAQNSRPVSDSQLCLAPYWNCYDNGVVCTGSMRVPQEKSVRAIELWEQGFFGSEFTHAAGVRKHTRFRGGLLALWQKLEGQTKFPRRYLCQLKQNLLEFVNDKDQSYRNGGAAA
jgi:PRTRC genetic system protein B